MPSQYPHVSIIRVRRLLPILILTLLSGSPCIAGRSSGFEPEQRLGLLDAPFVTLEINKDCPMVLVEDLNGDGLIDLAVPRGLTVSIFLASRTGGYQPRRDIPLPASSVSMAAGDFNGDSIIDLALTQHGDSVVMILTGDGTGNFRIGPAFRVAPHPLVIRSGDLDGDSLTDLVVVGRTGLVTVLRGDPSGYYFTTITLESVTSHVAPKLELRDVDGDRRIDIVLFEIGQSRISVFRNQEEGRFAGPVIWDLGNVCKDFELADFDEDGRLDLALLRANAPLMHFRPGVDGGLFGPGTTQIVPEDGRFLALLDIDRDGRDELISFHPRVSAGQVIVPGDVRFSPERSFPVLDFGVAIPADLDGDGFDELIIGGRGINIYREWGRRLPGNRGPEVLGSPAWVESGDLNGDGIPDLAVQSAHGVTILFGQGEGTFPTRTEIPFEGRPYLLRLGHLNDDRNLDILAVHLESNRLQLSLGDGKGRFDPGGSLAIDGGSLSQKLVLLADLDRDGLDDLITANPGDRSFRVFRNRRAGGFGPAEVVGVSGMVYALAIGDLDGNGTPDLVASNTVEDVLSLFFSRQDGTFGEEQVIPLEDPGPLVVGDVNGDGRADIVTTHQDAPWGLTALINQGEGRFRTDPRQPPQTAGRLMKLADFDGDQVPDLAMNSSGRDVVFLLFGHGDGTFDPPMGFGTGGGPVAFTVADLNGDGSPDLATANHYGQSVSILLNRRVPGPVGPVPAGFRLQPPSPNPFGPWTTVSWSLPGAGRAQLAVHDVTGRTVATLLDATLSGGSHTATWHGRDDGGRRVGAGVYFLRLAFENRIATARVTLTGVAR